VDLPFRIVLTGVFFAFIGHRGYYSRKMPPAEGDTLESQEASLRTTLAGILAFAGLGALLIYLVSPNQMAWASVNFPTWLRWGGVVVAGAGFGLLQWSQITLGANWSDTPRITKSQVLVTAGPYRWVRHPIYTAFLLILSAPLLIAANWFLGGAWIVMAAIDIQGRIKFEEEKMMSQFGEVYQKYRDQTGGLLPWW
jgi:protein-S-isoprenylcysteine O-methyltransferase Ste14